VLAKVFEEYDHAIYAATDHVMGGHALKHVSAAVSCLIILEMGRRRIRRA
jgi:hypothetical protein